MRTLEAGIGRHFAKGEEIARFNMGSTVIAVVGNTGAAFERVRAFGRPVRLGQALLRGSQGAS